MKLSPSQDNNFHRILAQPEAIKRGYEKYSLEHGAKILQTLETYFNVNYSLNKMDQAAIPDQFFASGASESWGLVMYREGDILVTPRITTKKLMYVDTLITHEFVHQWFGNLVTIKWWRYLWLKEGFAQFLESKIVDLVNPEWRRMEQFNVKEKHNVLSSDSSDKTRDMNQDAGTPAEIRTLYDRISYEKAACVIHMLETIMTPKIFKLGLTKFLQARAFQSAVPVDLYRNLQKSLDNSAIKLPQNLSIIKMMTTWDSQKGYPLVYVQRNYDKSPKVVNLTQVRFVSNEDVTLKPTTWYIPINYASKGNPNFNDTRFSDWLLKPKGTITVRNLKRDDWLVFNKQEAYYYRVNYDVKNWKLIAKALKENYRNVHILNRAQIIDDSFNLAKMHKLDYAIPLGICSYLHQEDDYITQFAFLRNMIYVARIVRGAAVEPHFQKYVIRTLKRSYDRLCHNHTGNDSLIDKLHRVLIVSWMCRVNYRPCRANTWKTFERWRVHNKSLEVDLEKEIMCNAIRHGRGDDWNYLFQKFEAADHDNFRKNAWESLGCTENVWTLQRIIDYSQNSNKYPLTSVLELISRKGLVGSQVSMNYVTENFNLLYSKFPDSTILKLLATITLYFTTETQLENFTELLSKTRKLNPSLFMFLENARAEISRTHKHVEEISNYFYRQQANMPNQIKSGGNLYREIPKNIFAIIIIYSLIVIMFYI